VSLLTACQAVRCKETGLGTYPATIISNTDNTAVQLKAIAERAAKLLMTRNWQKDAARAHDHHGGFDGGLQLPTDWARYVSQTAWDATTYWPMRGSIGAPLYQAEKRGLVTAVNVRKDFRVWQGGVTIFPTPTTVNTLIIEYIRNTPWTDSTGVTYRVTATADADITVFPERLLELEILWRWRRAKGLAYDEEKQEAMQQADLAYAQDTPSPILNFGVSCDRTPTFTANLPQNVV
jgi:hypothetical protein